MDGRKSGSASALSIKDEGLADAACELARRRGARITRGAGDAVAPALKRATRRFRAKGLVAGIREMSRRYCVLQLLDDRSADETRGDGAAHVPAVSGAAPPPFEDTDLALTAVQVA